MCRNVVFILSGGMGLDIGFEQTGQFKLPAFVETIPAFRETIRRNAAEALMTVHPACAI